jgi:hypothetical protein
MNADVKQQHMIIQLDTEKKTISLEDSINAGELFELLERMLPNGLWHSFTIQPKVKIEYVQSPVIVEKTVYPTYPLYPFNPTVQPYNPSYPGTGDPNLPWITYGKDTNTYSCNPGTFNIEVNYKK